jgi:hypothetical protein
MIKWDETRVQWMRELIQEHKHWPTVAHIMGIEESTARKNACKFGLRVPKYEGKQTSWRAGLLERLEARYATEKDPAVLALEFQCTPGAVAAAISRYIRPKLNQKEPEPEPPQFVRDPVHTLPVLASLEGWEPPPAVRVISPPRHCQWPDYACSGGLWRGAYCEYHYRVCYNTITDPDKDLAPWVRPRADVATTAEQA